MPEDVRDSIDRILRSAFEAAGTSDLVNEQATEAVTVSERLITRSNEAIVRSRGHLAKAPLSPAKRQEFEHLKLADLHLGLARVVMHRQRKLIDRLRRRGLPTGLAEMVLDTLQDSFAAMEGHRTLMRGRLGMNDE